MIIIPKRFIDYDTVYPEPIHYFSINLAAKDNPHTNYFNHIPTKINGHKSTESTTFHQYEKFIMQYPPL